MDDWRPAPEETPWASHAVARLALGVLGALAFLMGASLLIALGAGLLALIAHFF